MAKDAMFSPTIDRHHEAQERRQQLLSSRSAAIKDRVQRYVSQPGTYESEARVHTKSALDQLKQQQGEISARNRQFKEQEERKVMEHAHLQELQLQRRTNTRMEHQREAAAYNLQAAQARKDAQQRTQRADHQQARALQEHSFFDRFGTSLA